MSAAGFACGILVGSLGLTADDASVWAAERLTETQILDALKPKPRTRTLAPSPDEQRKAEEERAFIDGLRRRTRSLTVSDRNKVAEIAKEKPSVDLEVNFEYDSAVLSAEAKELLVTVGKVLRDPQLKGATFLLAGHTDAKGGDAYNRSLSNRRAEAVKRFLAETSGVPVGELVAIGYGKEQLKNTADPFAAENRRVQVVNTEQRATAAR
jgi:outer membrane protein OmpA-like peptidoglycan-associated protein